MKYKILLLIIIIFIGYTISCTLPPFDEELSETINATDEMYREAEIYRIQNLYNVDDSSFFIPIKNNLAAGFIITEKTDRIRIQYIENNQCLDETEYEIRKPSSKTNNYYVNIIPVSGGSDYLTFYRSFYYNSGDDNLFCLEYDGASIISTHIQLYDDITINTPPATNYLLGASVTQFGSINYAVYLAKDSSNKYYEELWEFDAIGNPGSPPYPNINNDIRGFGISIDFSTDLPTDLENVFYYFDIINNPSIVTSFISFYDVNTESYLSYKWYYDGAIQLEQLNIPYKISAILSSGLIYCVDRNKAYLYDFNGDYQYVISLGDLKFNYEIWDSVKSEYRMIFTHPFWTTEEYNEYLNFYIYSIATDELSLLR